MLCKITSKNQITLPKELLKKIQTGDYLNARIEDGNIVLEPMVVRPIVGERLAAIRRKAAASGVQEQDTASIVHEARRADRL